MADRTSQPATQVGINPLYAANAVFLWNAAVPNKNSLDGSDSATGLRGTDNTGTVGKYRVFGADGAMNWAINLPDEAYTLVVVAVFPTANIGTNTLVTMGASGGVRYEPYTSGGGVYENATHTAVAASGQNQVTGVGGFNTAGWVEVFAYSGEPGDQLRRYRKSGSGVETGGTETIEYANPGSGPLYLGSLANTTTQGIAAVMLVSADIGATECEELRDNPWRMFEPEGGGGGGSKVPLKLQLLSGG